MRRTRSLRHAARRFFDAYKDHKAAVRFTLIPPFPMGETQIEFSLGWRFTPAEYQKCHQR